MAENFNIKTDLTQYFTQMRQAVEATDALRSSMIRLRKTARDLDRILQTIPAKTKKVATEMHSVGIQSELASKNIKKMGKNLEVAGNQARKTSKSVLPLGKAAATFLAYQAASRAIGAFSNALGEAAAVSLEFQKSIAEIQTIDTTGLPFDQWAGELRTLSDSWGLDAVDQAKAAYQALSNQVVSGAETFEFLNAANQLARTGLATTEDSVNLLSSVINAYSMNARDADEISAKLFKTVELGRLRISDIANTFGRVAVLGGQVGISFDELNGLLATFTRQGVKANNAMTQIRAIAIKLLKPTDDMKELIKELGFESSATAVKAAGGLIPFLRLVNEYTQNSPEAVARLASRSQAIQGFISASKNIELLEDSIEQVADAQDDYGARTALVTTNASVQWEKASTQIKNIFAEDIFRPAFEQLAKGTNNFQDIVEVVEKAAVIFNEANVYVEAITTAIKVLNTTLTVANWIKYAQGLYWVYQIIKNVSQQTSDAMIEDFKRTNQAANSWADEFSSDLKEVDASFKESLDATEAYLSQQVRDVNLAYRSMSKDFIETTNRLDPVLKDIMSDVVSTYKSAISDIDSENNSLVSSIRKIFDEIAGADKTLAQDLLGIDLDNAKNATREFDILFKRYQELLAEQKVGFVTQEQAKDNYTEQRKIIKELAKTSTDINEANIKTEDERRKLLQKQADLTKEYQRKQLDFEAKIRKARTEGADALAKARRDQAEYEEDYRKELAQIKTDLGSLVSLDQRQIDAKSELIRLTDNYKTALQGVADQEARQLELNKERRKALILELKIFEDSLKTLDFSAAGIQKAFEGTDANGVLKAVEAYQSVITQGLQTLDRIGGPDTEIQREQLLELDRVVRAQIPVALETAPVRSSIEAQRKAEQELRAEYIKIAAEANKTAEAAKNLGRSSESAFKVLGDLFSVGKLPGGLLFDVDRGRGLLRQGSATGTPREILDSIQGPARTLLNLLENLNKINQGSYDNTTISRVLGDIEGLRASLADPKGLSPNQRGALSNVTSQLDVLEKNLLATQTLPNLEAEANKLKDAAEAAKTRVEEAAESLKKQTTETAKASVAIDTMEQQILGLSSAVDIFTAKAANANRVIQGYTIQAANPTSVRPVAPVAAGANTVNIGEINAPVTGNGVDVDGLRRALQREFDIRGARR